MPTHISLIRHGETDWNVTGKFQGHACVPLNEEGQRQAVLLAQHLAAAVQDVTALYSSDSLRTRQTAEVVAAQLGLPVQLDSRLREIDLGEWQGLTRAEAELWDTERYQIIMADPLNIPRPGGESGLQVAHRMLQVLEAIAAAHPGQYVLAVTHGGTIHNLLHLLGLADYGKDHILNTSITRFVYDPDKPDTRWLLDVFNQAGHLDTTNSAEAIREQEG